MRYWRKDAFEGLEAIAAAADAVPEWAGYVRYCRLRERGLRKQALHEATAFAEATVKAPFEDRLRFVQWLLEWEDGACKEGAPYTGATQLLRPRPVHQRIIAPTLQEWAEREATEAEPLFRLGEYRAALDRNPHHVRSRLALAKKLLGFASYSTHELPAWGYVGDPEEGLADLKEAELLLLDVPPSRDRTQMGLRIEVERAVTQSWIDYMVDFRETGERGFRAWAEARGRVHTPEVPPEIWEAALRSR